MRYFLLFFMISSDDEPFVLHSTADGSITVYDTSTKSHFHSLHGALSESLHVYVHGTGLPQRLLNAQVPLEILEIGLGTGMDLLLTAGYVNISTALANYVAFEPRPLPECVVAEYYSRTVFPEPAPTNGQVDAVCRAIGQRVELLDLGRLRADLRFRPWEVGEGELQESSFDVIYYDPFGPGTAPDMWTRERLTELVYALKPGGCLTSFSVSGAARRILAELPVVVERPRGYGRKLQMLRVTRN